MKSLFSFQETLEVITNGVPQLAHNANDTQRINQKDVKKKYYKTPFCFQSTMDVVNFNRISNVESAKEAWDILVKYYESGEKVKGVKLQELRR